MKITETVTFMGMFVNITDKSGKQHQYIRVEPNWWIYQLGDYLDPHFSVEELETVYTEFLVK